MSTPPTRPGFYWYRQRDGYAVIGEEHPLPVARRLWCVKVEHRGRVLVGWVPAMDYADPVDSANWDGEWLGEATPWARETKMVLRPGAAARFPFGATALLEDGQGIELLGGGGGAGGGSGLTVNMAGASFAGPASVSGRAGGENPPAGHGPFCGHGGRYCLLNRADECGRAGRCLGGNAFTAEKCADRCEICGWPFGGLREGWCFDCATGWETVKTREGRAAADKWIADRRVDVDSLPTVTSSRHPYTGPR